MHKQLTGLSLKTKEADLEFEKLHMDLKSLEQRLRDELSTS
jgi:hypothetical protein